MLLNCSPERLYQFIYSTESDKSACFASHSSPLNKSYIFIIVHLIGKNNNNSKIVYCLGFCFFDYQYSYFFASRCYFIFLPIVCLWCFYFPTSQEIDGETVETVSDFIFLVSKITADGDCSHEIKTLTPWKESYD